ncbi:alpha/beta family hydrolase [uncultured Microbacterium sp.]|uniref:Hydrolase of the alpha/beta-hydrolase fold-containing protein n=1 Tax=uncultured Microbacterium sp. TaxID=191216 RepID=A0A1Y5NV36_9MICO|nr:alpha/beta family hydrolase [uncultured Microbacterium sp.]SBS70297.1 Hydrolase of the alpha/beta-hydrolase fold-containing protein [uncultured Microbacterium sp.]
MSGIRVALPAGDVEVSAAFDTPDEPWAAVAVAHGAGAGMDHPFLVGLAGGLAAAGIATLRFNFPYLEAGRRMPGPAPHAIATWGAVMADLGRRAPGLAHFAAGKSYGGRMASMAAAAAMIGPAGLVYLGYPLHPPGEPDKARTAHLPHVVAPQLFVAGTGDPFIHPLAQLEEAVQSCQDAEIAWITGGGHSFEIKGAKRPADEVGAGLAPLLAEWMRGVIQRPAA